MKRTPRVALTLAQDRLGEYRARGPEGMSQDQYQRCVAAVLRRCLEAGEARCAELEALGLLQSKLRLTRRMLKWRLELEEIEQG